MTKDLIVNLPEFEVADIPAKDFDICIMYAVLNVLRNLGYIVTIQGDLVRPEYLARTIDRLETVLNEKVWFFINGLSLDVKTPIILKDVKIVMLSDIKIQVSLEW